MKGEDGIEVEVKDISVGGIMFVSKKKIEVGEHFSFAFVSGKKEIMVQAVIKVQRPVHVSGIYESDIEFIKSTK